MTRRRRLIIAVCALLLPLLGASTGAAADLQIRTSGPDASPLAGLVVLLLAQGGKAAEYKAPASAGNWVMDQVDLQFEPEVLVVPVGARVSFPNSDVVAHQVYSFSPARRFSLGLYRGQRYPPVDFTKPGLVVLGCNIHDSMVGYVYVSESPYFGKSDATGLVQFSGLPAGSYLIKAWSPRFKGEEPETLGQLSLGATETQSLSWTVRSARRPPAPKLVHPKGLHY